MESTQDRQLGNAKARHGMMDGSSMNREKSQVEMG
jgi:hypothetical protein